jgi:hypothetical protein
MAPALFGDNSCTSAERRVERLREALGYHTTKMFEAREAMALPGLFRLIGAGQTAETILWNALTSITVPRHPRLR